MGMLRASMPAELGGHGVDAFTWGVTLETVGYLCEDGSLPLVVSLYAAVANALWACGSPTIRDRFVAPMAAGERFGAFAYTENADAFSFRSTATQRGGGWVLQGDKEMVTGGQMADTFMTYLRMESGDLGVFVIDREDPGVEVRPVEVAGLRAAGLASLHLRDVEVPADRLVVETDGLGHVQQFLNDRRGLLVCGPLGRMRAIVERVAAHANATVRYGQPVATLPNVQSAIGRMAARVHAARAVTHHGLAGTRRADRDRVLDPGTAVAKHFVVDAAVAVAQDALRIVGGAGYQIQNHYERYLRDFIGGIAGGGAQDILEVNLGARVCAEVERAHRFGEKA